MLVEESCLLSKECDTVSSRLRSCSAVSMKKNCYGISTDTGTDSVEFYSRQVAAGHLK